MPMTDGLDLAGVTIHNSHDVHGWPATADLTKLEFRPTGVHVEHTKNQGAGAWPNFRPAGWDGDLQYTLWIFVQVLGGWHGSGCIQFWQSCDQNGGPPEEFAQNWYYAADRWAPMTGHQPAPGELVGFMVSAGDARNSGAQSVQERSQIVAMPFPVSGAVWVQPVAGPGEPEPPGPAAPPAEPLPTSPVLLNVLEQMVKAFDEQGRALTALQQAQADALEVVHNTLATKEDVNQLRRELITQGKALAAALRAALTPKGPVKV